MRIQASLIHRLCLELSMSRVFRACCFISNVPIMPATRFGSSGKSTRSLPTIYGQAGLDSS